MFLEPGPDARALTLTMLWRPMASLESRPQNPKRMAALEDSQSFAHGECLLRNASLVLVHLGPLGASAAQGFVRLLKHPAVDRSQVVPGLVQSVPLR